MEDWYELVTDDHLQQGDFVRNLSIYAQDSPDDREMPQPEFDVYRLAVIMSQSCDLTPERDHKYALLCAVYPVDQLAETWGTSDLRSRWAAAKKGNAINYHPLAPCALAGHERPAALVDFRRVFEVKIARLRELCARDSPWLRLGPPYREQLAQRFASKIMRIGLPVDVPEWSEIETSLDTPPQDGQQAAEQPPQEAQAEPVPPQQ